MKPGIAIRYLLGVAALGLALAGCAGSSQYMKEVMAPQPITAPADRASVVFVRPSGLGFAVNYTIVDHHGQWVGDSVAESQFAVTLPPGEYLFVAWAGNTAALKATLAPGRVYYVEVIPVMGAFVPMMKLEALTPRHSDWPNVPKWLKETKTLEPLPAGAASIQAKQADVLEHVASARENWQGYSAEEKQERTLRPEDGVAAASSPAVAAGSAPSPPNCPPGAACTTGAQGAAPAQANPPVGAVAAPPPPAVPIESAAAAPPSGAPAAAAATPLPGTSCLPRCRTGFTCSAAGICVADAPAPARAATASANPHDECQPPCRKGYLCGPHARCVSACNPPCAPGERCTESGECQASSNAPTVR
jgi:hypothetical protein